jgi:hypothetical protein
MPRIGRDAVLCDAFISHASEDKVFELVEATAGEATLTARVPVDAMVCTTATWWCRVSEGEYAGIPTVDPVVVLGPHSVRDAERPARSRMSRTAHQTTTRLR